MRRFIKQIFILIVMLLSFAMTDTVSAQKKTSIAEQKKRVEQYKRDLERTKREVQDLKKEKGSATQLATDGLVVVFIKSEDTGKITWITYVHGIGNGRYRRTRIILGSLQVLVENIIRIIRRNETPRG